MFIRSLGVWAAVEPSARTVGTKFRMRRSGTLSATSTSMPTPPSWTRTGDHDVERLEVKSDCAEANTPSDAAPGPVESGIASNWFPLEDCQIWVCPSFGGTTQAAPSAASSEFL